MSETATETDAEFVRTSAILALAWSGMFMVASLGLLAYGDVLMRAFA